MAFKIRRVNYYYLTIKDEPGAAYQLLTQFSGLGINLLAFTAIPIGPTSTQLTIFPDDKLDLESLAKKSGLNLEGPHPAFHVQGDDELGALAQVHYKLFVAHVNVYAASGTSDGRGNFGYIIYVKPADYTLAAEALGI
ncbi:MAG: hypothetical protein KDC80_09070 [Saprospiraceae bacterium]|nr:hypothetical protein [Saprospiraceae bacterium]